MALKYLSISNLSTVWTKIKAYLSSNYQPKGSYLTSHQDISGLETKANAITGLSVSGKVITYTKGNGTSGTITTQDTNTTYSFSNKAATLSWNTTSTIATVGGVDITVKMPGNPNTNTTYSAGSNITLSGTTFSLTKANVVGALGYTPPTSNTTYSAGSNITLSGTTFSLTKANVVGALGYTPPTSNTTYSKLSQFTNNPGYITSSGSCNYATSAGNGYDSSGDGWIRFNDGTQICSKSVVCSSATATITYPKAFSNTPMPIICYGDTAGVSGTEDICVKYSYASTFVVYKYNFSSNYRLNYIVVGKWK